MILEHLSSWYLIKAFEKRTKWIISKSSKNDCHEFVSVLTNLKVCTNKILSIAILDDSSI